ncbi:MauE/DoxX family redox-associated membrane protein [Parafilimonas sp.]|uniref:MauE/DoxX family redox-associated membrane protein n=1 Tax=Parafilimonas sp. TaxID=1969739 RepID=UPI0039E5BC48
MIEIICSLLILLFAYAGVSKLAGHKDFQAQLINLPLISYAAPVLSYILPLLEILLSITLAMPSIRLYGLYISLTMLVLFSMYLTGMVIFKTDLPCSCGGIIAGLSWKQHVLFNLFFIALSGVGIKQQREIVKYQNISLSSLLQ